MTVASASRGFLRSPAMQAATRAIEDALASPGGVLICGERGTGREMIARAIHRAAAAGVIAPIEILFTGPRGADAGAPFIVVDCATCGDVERHLFGQIPNGEKPEHDRISVESAIHQAFGGTLFLGSVHDVPARLQNRLARILRDGEVEVEDATGTVRIVSAKLRAIASVDPIQAGEDDRIVPELYKRLAAHRIELPPLRQRKEDIPALVRLFLADICESLEIPPKSASTQATALLCALPWRGNFTELRGLLRTLALKVPGVRIRLADVLANIRLDGGATTFSGGGTLKQARDRFEREYVAAVLEQHRGRMAEAARSLGIQRTNLYRKVRQLSLERRRAGRA